MPVITYVRKEDKKHSVVFEPKVANKDEDVLGNVYVKRSSGLADEKELEIEVRKKA